MNAMLKWTGGAAGAVLLGFGGGALVSGAFTSQPAPAPTIEQAIPVDPAAFARPTYRAPAPTAATSGFTVRRILDIPGPIKYGQWFWDDKGVPAGPLVITVDLDARVLSVFRGGYEIGAAAVLVGNDEYPTPLGTFPVIAKERHNVSEKYGDAPMPWTMRLTNDGVAIHGGSAIRNGYASHGCIAGPDAFVARIFAVVKPGDKVIVTRGKMMKMGDPIV